jgi:hypothetical protein
MNENDNHSYNESESPLKQRNIFDNEKSNKKNAKSLSLNNITISLETSKIILY